MPMIRIQRSALLPYPAEHLYQLVCDIPEYPTFIGGCSAARIVRTWEQGVEAELTIGAMGGHYSFSTRNTLVEPREIRRLRCRSIYSSKRQVHCRVSRRSNWQSA
jgi:ribosome-associated toxin RatA of RatAB toxin-antitoxin module